MSLDEGERAPRAPLADTNGAAAYHCDWRDLLSVVPRCDALITDCPYSEKTHSGHGTVERWGVSLPPTYDGGQRREIDYQHWTPADVDVFVAAWHPRTAGWFVSITDDVLAPAWQASLEAVGRYVFAPLPFVAPGSRVRLSGDGPSSWTCWIIVARPRTKEFSTWGTLPGAYVLPSGQGGHMPVVGGKPPWLLCRLIEDYSRPDALVCDPCCGAGTAGVAAIRTGRRAILGDVDQETAELAAQWIHNPYQPAPRMEATRPPLGQGDLFARSNP